MTLTLSPLPGFNWLQVVWGAPNERRRESCSYCDTPLGPNDVPLILWRNPDGWCAEFCPACQTRWWGFMPMSDDPPDDRYD